MGSSSIPQLPERGLTECSEHSESVHLPATARATVHSLSLRSQEVLEFAPMEDRRTNDMERYGQHLLARIVLVFVCSSGSLGCTEVTAQPQEVVGEPISDGVLDADIEPESSGDLSSDLPSTPLDGVGPELPPCLLYTSPSPRD